MRPIALTGVLAMALGLSITPANAAPAVSQTATPRVSNIVEVVGGCGPRFEPNRLGQCIPIRGQHEWDSHYERAVRGY